MRRRKTYFNECFICFYFFLTFGLCDGFPGLTNFQTGTHNSLFNDVDPDFSEAISNVTVPVGREAILSCSVTDLGQFKVGWLKAEDQTILTLHNKVVTHNSRISVSHDNANTWQLHIRQVKESDRGCYMCQINTNKMKKQLGCIDVHDRGPIFFFGKRVIKFPWSFGGAIQNWPSGKVMLTSTPGTLTVPPDIIDEETSSDVTVREGENATLVCRAKGHPVPRIIWRREDGEHLQFRSGPREIVKAVDSYLSDKFSLTKVTRTQMGAYLCIASNDVPPAVSKRVMLNINFPPSIKIPNQLLGAPLGTNVLLECHVEAFPNTINYWMKNRGEMLLNGKKHIIEEEKNSYRVHLKLKVANFSKSDLGTYMCVSTNSLGRADGTIRLYEIKIPTKMPTTTTITEAHVSFPAAVETTTHERVAETKRKFIPFPTLLASLESIKEESSIGRSSTLEKHFNELNVSSSGRISQKFSFFLAIIVVILHL